MLYTIVNIYDVLRTDSVYENSDSNYLEVKTDPYEYLN